MCHSLHAQILLILIFKEKKKLDEFKTIFEYLFCKKL